MKKLNIGKLNIGESLVLSAFDENYFSNYAGSGEDYGKTYNQYTENAKAIKRLINFHKLPVSTILDAGCAYGYLVRDLRLLGYDAKGIEISDVAIEKIPSDLKPFCTQMDMRDIANLNETFDLVFINSAMYLTEEEIKKFLTDLKIVASYIYIVNPYIGESVPDKERVTLKHRNWWKKILTQHNWVPYPGTDFLCKLKN